MCVYVCVFVVCLCVCVCAHAVCVHTCVCMYEYVCVTGFLQTDNIIKFDIGYICVDFLTYRWYLVIKAIKEMKDENVTRCKRYTEIGTTQCD